MIGSKKEEGEEPMSPEVRTRCGQGYIYACRLVPTGEILQICEECDAVWNLVPEGHRKAWIDAWELINSAGYRTLATPEM